MENEELIPLEVFCIQYQIEISFIQSLSEYGLIEIVAMEEKEYLHQEHIRDLERMIRLHYDLDINIEGIEAIAHLLQRVDHLQGEVNTLKNKLRFYEGEE
jgi:hypothetical protein